MREKFVRSFAISKESTPIKRVLPTHALHYICLVLFLFTLFFVSYYFDRRRNGFLPFASFLVLIIF